ncbi:DUF4391 domain-containing protein [Paenibacillus sp. EPM92]|uniref:DUF4391 domain-containing protein n=1 Tax=Paenibacillus sp. EPM92 TaxID=1561195 RepID=UPI001915379D|nr:DUF4391 domain-containing protein [Paenibacillus sp. EPM92]
MQKNIENWISIPKSGQINRRIPKNMFYEQPEFNNRDKQLFVDYLDSIRIVGILNQDVISTQPFVSDELNYTDISILLVQLKNLDKCKPIAKLIHETIPYPALIFLYEENEIIVSTAMKRIHQIKKDKAIVDEVAFSHKLNLTELREPDLAFVEKLHLATLPYSNFYRLFQELHNRVQITNTIDVLGIYPSKLDSIPSIQEWLKRIEDVSEEIKRLNNQMNKEKNFGKKMDIHVKIKMLEKRLTDAMEKLSEVC